jgi:hypothetical protein
MPDTKTTTAPRAKRSRPGSPLEFEKPKMSCAETEERLVRAVGIRDPDFLSTFINQVVAVSDLGEPSNDHEINFSLSAIEDIVSNQSNGGVAKAILAAQYTAVHAAIMRVSRRFTRTSDLQCQDIIGRLLSSLARTSVAQYEALNRVDTGVTVGHVSVNQGGQAIVGSVTQNQQEPATQKTAPPQPLIADAKTIPMPIIEESEERVPVPVWRTQESKPTGKQ